MGERLVLTYQDSDTEFSGLAHRELPTQRKLNDITSKRDTKLQETTDKTCENLQKGLPWLNTHIMDHDHARSTHEYS